MLMLPAGSFCPEHCPEAVEVTAPGNRQLKLAVDTPAAWMQPRPAVQPKK